MIGLAISELFSKTTCANAPADYLRLTSAALYRDTRVQNFQFRIAPQL